MGLAIEIEGLGKQYPGSLKRRSVRALDEVTLKIAEGEVFGYIGPNGAGKTTTIKILTGSVRASCGKVRVLGADADDPRSRLGLGYVPENPQLYDHLTAYEIVCMSVRLHRVKTENLNRHVMDWLDRFGLREAAHRPLRGYSKGMVQRTALAQALAIRPRLLILDEPLSGLDPIGRRDVVDILSDYRGQGGTVFLTSHVLHDVERLADRFGLIHQGRLKAVRSPADLVGGEDLVMVRSQGSAELSWMHQEAPGRWTAEVHREDLWPQLKALEAAGHVLIEVKPVLSLEQAFLRAVG